jgi:hypothetical protein
MLIYFSAALCFVFAGILDFVYKPGCLGACMILAGLFGLASAVLVEEDEWLSIVFNSVSVHLFALEAIQVCYWQESFPGLDLWFQLASYFFLVGTLIDVGLSYVISWGNFGYGLAKIAIFSACCWLVTAFIYVATAIYVQQHGGFKGKGEVKMALSAYQEMLEGTGTIQDKEQCVCSSDGAYTLQDDQDYGAYKNDQDAIV